MENIPLLDNACEKGPCLSPVVSSSGGARDAQPKMNRQRAPVAAASLEAESLLRKGDVAAARPRFIQVQTKHLDHSGDCIGGIRWTRTTTLPPSRKSEGSMLHLPGVFGCLTCLHGEVMGTYQGSLGHFGPRGPDRPRAGACRGLGPGPGPRARDGPGPKGSQREDKAGARPLASPGRCMQVPIVLRTWFQTPKKLSKRPEMFSCSSILNPSPSFSNLVSVLG